MSKIEVDEIVNQTGDNDSGIDLSTNDQIGFKIANASKWTLNSSGNLFPASTSQGIVLGATSDTSANRLEDYEEGTTTFTININGVTSPNGASYSYNTAPYVKIGRQVFCQISMNVSFTSTPSGGVKLIGLPFTEGQGGGYREPGIMIGNTSSSNLLRGAVNANSNDFNLFKGHSSSQLNGTDIASGMWLHGSVVYQTS